jgi:RimJ/RimL family protein N-acetyltransferase
MRAWIHDRNAPRRGLPTLAFLQRDTRTARAMGSTSLFDWNAAEACAEIGHTWLAAPYRRTGANTEAKLLLLTHGFESLGLQRIQLVTDARNVRSQSAIERLGATREGVLRKHRRDLEGGLRDSVYYSVIAPEWPAVKARILGSLRA